MKPNDTIQQPDDTKTGAYPDKLFVVVSDKSWYEGYIPFYIYFARRACPDAHVAVYLRGKIDPLIVDLLRQLGIHEGYTFIEDWKLDYGDSVIASKASRWVINDATIKRYRYAYIGDIDIMISRETPDLFEQHKQHAEFLGLPFSNIVRQNSKRISGLHFIRTKEYFEQTDAVISRIDASIKNHSNIYLNLPSDEIVLYQIAQESGLITPSLSISDNREGPESFHFRPHHGVHLGCFRNTKMTQSPYLDKMYFTDLLAAFREVPVLYDVVSASHTNIRRCFEAALSHAEQMNKAMPTQTQILFVVDSPGWAHDHKTSNIIRSLSDEFKCRKVYSDQIQISDIEWADLVLVYYWKQFRSEVMRQLLPVFQKHRQKMLIGICSHHEMRANWRAEGLSVLRTLANAIFVNSCLLYKEFSECCEVPVFYTPNGVDTSFFVPPKKDSDTPVLAVGWAGSLTNQGNKRGYHDIIVPAVQSLEGVKLLTAAREEKWRTYEQMRDFYHQLDVYVCASVSESGPNPCLEAAASGVPVVTTPVGVMPELIESGVNGFFIERTVESLAEKLRLLRDDPALRKQMGQAARQTILGWDWRHQAENYRQMFRAMRSRRRSRQATAQAPSQEPLEHFQAAQAAFGRQEYRLAQQHIDQYRRIADYSHFAVSQNHTRSGSPFLSVIVVTYNRPADAELCLKTLREQSFGDRYEIVLVDNGTDLAVQAARLADTFVDCPINFNLSEGRNIGAHFARGEILVFLDDDAIPGTSYLQSIAEAFDRYDVCGLRGRAFPKTQNSGQPASAVYDYGEQPFATFCNQEGNSAFRRDIWVKLGGMDPLLFGHEGSDLSYRIAKEWSAYDKVIYWPGSVIYHDYGSPEKRKAKRRQYQINRLYLNQKHGGDILALNAKLTKCGVRPRLRTDGLPIPSIGQPSSSQQHSTNGADRAKTPQISEPDGMHNDVVAVLESRYEAIPSNAPGKYVTAIRLAELCRRVGLSEKGNAYALEALKFKDNGAFESARRRTVAVSPQSSDAPGPKVTVVTACHNAERYLAESLESVRRQSLQEWELFLLDDASSDGTREIIQEYARRDARIKAFYFDTNAGPYVRRNFAIERAGSDFIVIQDSDDLMTPTKLETLYSAISSDSRLAMVGSFYRTFLDEFKDIRYTDPVDLPLEHGQIAEQAATWQHGISHIAAIIRKSMFDCIGGYDENPFGSDAFWSAKLAEYSRHNPNIRFENLPEYLTLYRIHEVSQTQALSMFDPRNRRIRYRSYCEYKLKRVREKIRSARETDVARELRACTCSDFLTRFKAEIIKWENEPLDIRVPENLLKNAVAAFNSAYYVSCVNLLNSVETMEPSLPKRIVGFDLLRAMAFFALDMNDHSAARLEDEIANHDSLAARKFKADAFEQEAELDVAAWYRENAQQYNVGLHAVEREATTCRGSAQKKFQGL